MKKRVIGLLFLALLSFTFTACGDAAVSGTTQARPSKDTGDTNQQPDAEDGQEAPTKTVVVYFSCTGTTKLLAEYAAEILNADLCEIMPEIPYTEEDLNYSDSSSRASKEQYDPSARPPISGTFENMEEYDIVLLAYPIWWGQAPRIISTFLESYDFTDKTVVPFCTSHSSGVGSSAVNFHGLCSDSTKWLEGERFSYGTTKTEIEKWIDGISI